MMTTNEDDNAVPSVRFKRRKTTHTKRPRVEDDTTPVAPTQSPDAATPINAPEAAQEEEESAPNLKEILRNRKRPRDRLKHVSRKPEVVHTELAQAEAPRADKYSSRFIAQTGQVVDSGDAQMTVYVEARMAEQNHRQYGWPIPSHLQSTVAAIAPDLKHTFTSQPVLATSNSNTIDGGTEHSSRAAAGQSKLEEVNLDSSVSRTHKDWNSPPPPKVRLGRDGKPRRNRNRRTSDDIKRDQMVEAVLSEAKLEYFDETPAPSRFAGTDDDMVERFRNEYFESIEGRQARKPTQPPGAKDQPKGPKLGGSRSARAAMQKKEEAAAKKR